MIGTRLPAYFQVPLGLSSPMPNIQGVGGNQIHKVSGRDKKDKLSPDGHFGSHLSQNGAHAMQFRFL